MSNKKEKVRYIGRSTRFQYCVLMIVCLVPGFLVAEYSTGFVGLVALVLLTIPIIHVNIGRWQDLGYSGWMTPLMFIPYVGLLVTLYLLFAKGEEKDNKYGPNPYVEKYSELSD